MKSFAFGLSALRREPSRTIRKHRPVAGARAWFALAAALVVAVSLGLAAPAIAADEPAPGDPSALPDKGGNCVALVDKALAYLKANGRDKALAAFNSPDGEFVKDGLYVFAYDFYGVNKALATNPALVGTNLIDAKDAEGREFIKGMIGLVRKGGGWYDYIWEGHEKTSYVVKADDTLWIGCGEYKNEAVTLVEKALAYIKAVGKEKALAEFNKPNGAFVDRGLYIFAYDFNGVNKSLATHHELVGKELLDMKDPDGKPFIREMIATVSKGGGWVDYKWDGYEKSSYVVRVDDDLWIGCGEFRHSAAKMYGLFGLAIIPIIWLMISLGVLKMPAHVATLLSLGITVALALAAFNMPALWALTATLEGAALGLWPIVLVIVAAIFTYNMALHTKSMDTIKTMLANITTDRRIQVLILAWGFGGFLEAVAGYGTAVAIPASILAALGCDPLFAALICLTANTVPTAFGAIGIPVLTLAQLTNLDVNILSYQIALQLTLFIIVIPMLLVVLTTRSLKGLKGVVGISLASGAAFAIPELLAARFLGAELPALAGSVCSMAVTIFIAKKFYKEEHDGQAGPSITFKQGFLAWLPYILVLAFIVGSSPVVEPVYKALASIKTSVTIYQGKGAAPFVFKWIATPGTLIIIATVIAGLIQGARMGEIVSVFFMTVKKLSKSAFTVLCIVSMSKVMAYSGMISAIAVVLVKVTGPYFAFISPMIGALGTFVTGSDTSANVLFGKLQVEVASKTGVDPYWLAAANTAGATGGKMISPQSIAVATAATGLVGSEGRILNQTLKYCMVYVAFLGVFVYLGSLFLKG
nr:lactate permease LctP family transporter [Fundidesulfovibrio soli]